jgi:hypothetical protein
MAVWVGPGLVVALAVIAFAAFAFGAATACTFAAATVFFACR